MPNYLFLDDMGMMRQQPPQNNQRNLPPHQRMFQNEFGRGPPNGPPTQMGRGPPNQYQAQSVSGSIQGKSTLKILPTPFL